MEIKLIVLQTKHLPQMKTFYTDTLGFDLVKEAEDSFRIAVGTGEMEFTTKAAEDDPYYHFAFNLPANKFYEAKSWIKEKVNLLVEDGADEADFAHLPAHALYFYDPSGNIVELISRHGTTDESSEPFSVNSIVNISEIGLIVEDAMAAGERLNELGLNERDGHPISRQFLNFMGEKENGVFIILAQPGRRWIFSDKLSAIYPLEITLMNNNKIIVSPNKELLIRQNG